MRHAYSSPDMIMKIRRANEASMEERSVGVPWRHRLKNSERREFVMAEIRRPGVGKERSRGSEMEIHRAVLAARNPKESKFGECLINVNTKQDPVLKRRLGRISTEMRRMEFRMQQLKQHFVKNNPCLNHEPLILVERPASPQLRRRAKVIQIYGEDPDNLDMPGYMRPLRSRCKTPSTLTTIDAFMLRTKKKRNVWEEAMDEKEPPRFRSTVRPSAKLTPHEMAALHLGWDAHKPRVDLSREKISTSTTNNTNTKLSSSSYPSTREAIMDTPFVTQLPRKELPKTPDGRLLMRSVVVDQLAVAAASSSSLSSSLLPEGGGGGGGGRGVGGGGGGLESETVGSGPTNVSSRPKGSKADSKRRVAIRDEPFFITQSSA